jgi:hypothetical protein
MKNLTLGEMKQLNENAGERWFKKEEMRFFGTILETKPNVKDLFITSEWIVPNRPERGYTLRWFERATGKVHTIGEMNEYKTLEEAKQARDLMKKII